MRNYKFKTIEGDMDYNVSQYSFSGKMTKLRWKLLDRYVRKNSFSGSNCGHEWDCCGCLCSRTISLTYSANQVTITQTENFNY